jgi:hypothetical protein
MSDDNERGVIFTPELKEEGKVDEFPSVAVDAAELEAEEKIMEGVEELVSEEPKELTDEEKKAIFIEQLKQSKIKFHPLKHGVKTTVTETSENTVFGRKRKLKSKEILTNVTINQFGADYRKKRQRKNKMANASRKANRK